jgi:hypothetical protein
MIALMRMKCDVACLPLVDFRRKVSNEYEFQETVLAFFMPS